ncbi:MAG TPA: phytoene/squalene synthase family protein [Verrucomicrobiota bacterium]|nr:phytoene/squalene synthase family protein [Verrucomicrobiota bacterium]HNU50356.1 phytoene/squalene synthase family protein [Verrucomicrobiota bacterium]
MGSNDLLTRLLRDVSRSFYLTLRVLPPAIRPQVGLAYLLARATDTIADTALVPLNDRLETLERLRDRVLGQSAAAPDFSRFAAGSGAEQRLLARVGEAAALLDQLAEDDRELVRTVLATITSGQVLDLRRFAGAGPGPVAALQTDAELEDYAYRVAGCVGEFWTRICQRRLFPHAAVDEPQLLHWGRRFGIGLQLVNILRDLPRDLRLGRCYLPGPALAAAGLEPASLLDPAVQPRFRPVHDRYRAWAAACLDAGWAYTNALPRNQARVRLACVWPLLIGAKTLERLGREELLDPAHRVKVSRPEVWRIVVVSVAAHPWPRAWSRLWRRGAA